MQSCVAVSKVFEALLLATQVVCGGVACYCPTTRMAKRVGSGRANLVFGCV